MTQVLKIQSQANCVSMNDILTQLGYQLHEAAGYQVDESGIIGEDVNGNPDPTAAHTETWDIPRQPLKFIIDGDTAYDFWYILDPRPHFPEYVDQITAAMDASGITYEALQMPTDWNSVDLSSFMS